MTAAAADELAREAVVYTWPLYEMSRMRAATSPRRTDKDGPAGDGPQSTLRWCNVFTHSRRLLGAGRSRVVTPNNDTLYTTAWLDLAAEPLVIDVPDTADRYYVLGLLDFYTNPFAHLGQRLHGTGAGSFLVTPPGWRGTVPPAFSAAGRHVQAPTRWIWIIGRILVDGEHDVPAVNALQDRFRLRPLSAWLAGERSSTSEVTSAPATASTRFDAVIDPAAPPTAAHYRAVVNAALRDNPPPADELAYVARFAALGIGTDEPAEASAEQVQRLDAAIEQTLAHLNTEDAGGSQAGGWKPPLQINATYGADYEQRARVALKYIGALESREASYSLLHHDADGQPLTGEHAYRMRFEAGQAPPVDAFWSLTMYDSNDFMLVPNAIGRYAVGDRTTGLVRDPDGAFTLHLQHAPPTDAAAQCNWLPAPGGRFYLCLRAYLPRPALLDGRYLPPSPVRVRPDSR